MRSIKEAVHSDLERVALGLQLGGRAVRRARRGDERPGAVREICARGATGWSSRRRPRARWLPARSNIERVDRLVQTIAAQKGMHNDAVDKSVIMVESWLERNRSKA